MEHYKHVFMPLRIGNVEIRNRIEIPPMLSCLGTRDGFTTREMIEFYQAFARGGAGIVTIGDTAVDSDYAPGHHMQFIIGDDRAINDLNKLAEAIQKYGSVISIELNHTFWIKPCSWKIKREVSFHNSIYVKEYNFHFSSESSFFSLMILITIQLPHF